MIFVTNLKVRQFVFSNSDQYNEFAFSFNEMSLGVANLEKFDLKLGIDSDCPSATICYLSIWQIYHCGEKKK